MKRRRRQDDGELENVEMTVKRIERRQSESLREREREREREEKRRVLKKKRSK